MDNPIGKILPRKMSKYIIFQYVTIYTRKYAIYKEKWQLKVGTSTAQEKHKNEEVKNELAALNYKKERDKYIF